MSHSINTSFDATNQENASILNLQLSNIKKANDPALTFDSYNHAIEIAKQLHTSPTKSVVLLAEMQRGKTAIAHLTKTGFLQVSGLSERDVYFVDMVNLASNEIRDNTDRDFKKMYTDIYTDADNALISNYISCHGQVSKLASKINLRHIKAIVLTIDECHYGIGLDGRVDTTIKAIEAKAAKQNVAVYKIYVTATPTVIGLQQQVTDEAIPTYTLPNPESYISLSKLIAKGIIQDNTSPNFTLKNGDLTPEILLEIANAKKGDVHIWRATGKKADSAIKAARKLVGHHNVIDLDAAECKRSGFSAITKPNPDSVTIVVVRGKLLAGERIKNKQAITVVRDTRESNESGILQSLVGRMCGYPRLNDRLIIHTEFTSCEKYAQISQSNKLGACVLSGTHNKQAIESTEQWYTYQISLSAPDKEFYALSHTKKNHHRAGFIALARFSANTATLDGMTLTTKQVLTATATDKFRVLVTEGRPENDESAGLVYDNFINELAKLGFNVGQQPVYFIPTGKTSVQGDVAVQAEELYENIKPNVMFY